MLTRTIRRCFSINPLRSIIRSESQNLTWSYNDVEKHSDAFSNGIQELGFGSGDKLVTWFDKSHVTESLVTQLGCLKAGVTIVPIQGNSINSFVDALGDSQVKGAIISPNGRADDNLKKSELLLKEFPELKTGHTGENVALNNFPNVDFVIQTGFYNIPGTFKYKDVLLYSNPNFLNFELNNINEDDNLFEGVTLGEATDESASFGYNFNDRTLAVLADINGPNAFIKSALTSYTNGTYSIFITNPDEALSILRNVENPVVIHDDSVPQITLDGLKSIGVQEFISI